MKTNLFYLGVCCKTLFYNLKSEDFSEIGCVTDNTSVDSFFITFKQ